MQDPKKMSQPLVAPLRAAWLESKLTLAQLAERAGLKLSVVSMSRKLSGNQAISIPEEAEALGSVLKLDLRWDKARKAFRYDKRKAA